MNRHPGFIKTLALCLAFLYAVTGDHLLCAHLHCPHAELSCDHHPDDHSQEGRPLACCQIMPIGSELECDGSDRLALRLVRHVDETESLFPALLTVFCSVTPVTHPPALAFAGFDDVVAPCLPAPSLRLHLYFGVLLI